ncbi:MAG: class I SAM-dependent methyltransferase [Polyangiaceae bacterium]|nr:class I SAM-dependent methyltransferase [Polyangiaceae bacterium]
MTTPNTDHWWQAFYLGPFQELQLGGIHNDRAPAEVTLLEQNLKLEPHHRILDAPCGQGRHTLELARRGYAVTRIDFNPNVLAHAQAVAESEGLRPRFDQQDLRALSYESVFDRVLCLWGSFGYFSDTENLAQLQGMARALKPGGALHLETWTTEGLFPQFRPRDWSWAEGRGQRYRLLEERTFDIETSRANVIWTFVCEGRNEIVSHRTSIRVYSYRELLELLRTAGFQRFESYGGVTGKPYQFGSGRLGMVAWL